MWRYSLLRRETPGVSQVLRILKLDERIVYVGRSIKAGIPDKAEEQDNMNRKKNQCSSAGPLFCHATIIIFKRVVP
jgi:hypothetical protein